MLRFAFADRETGILDSGGGSANLNRTVQNASTCKYKQCMYCPHTYPQYKYDPLTNKSLVLYSREADGLRIQTQNQHFLVIQHTSPQGLTSNYK